MHTDTLWIAGGLYGNPEALDTLLGLFESEPGDKALVFNGDFHWFDVDRADFARINAGVLPHQATRGNVETELAFPSPGTGCGCGYPDWVGNAEVERSNRIMERLRATALQSPDAIRQLAALPMHRIAEVGGERVAIVHGDADSLAGWAFSEETLATGAGLKAARAAFASAGMRVVASSHTCLPVLQFVADERVVANNGAAGMPNFADSRFGLATRISVHPRSGALYGTKVAGIHVEAHPIPYDHAAWCRRFLGSWPESSDAHASYFSRILNGPKYSIDAALRVDRSIARKVA